MPHKKQLEELVYIDDLTGLYNRRYLYQRIPEEIEKSKASSAELTLFMIDVDRFKSINDTYGHLCGDSVLTEVSEILKQVVREKDVVIRYAGDEFICILPGTGKDISLAIAERLVETTGLHAFKGPKDQPNIRVTLSVGFATFPHDAQDLETLIGKADQVLYTSKHKGRNRVSQTKDITEEVINRNKQITALPCQKLIAREKELAFIGDIFEETLQSNVRCVFIHGPVGVGKSRFLEEIRELVGQRGAGVLEARCSEEGLNSPYHILADVLERRLASSGEELSKYVAGLPKNELIQLCKFLPSLKGFEEQIPKSKKVEDKETRIYFLKGFGNLLGNFSKEKPIVLLLDDYHWADEATIQFVNYLARVVTKLRILLCATYNKDKLKDNEGNLSPLGLFLKKVVYGDAFKEISLEGLPLSGVSDMVATTFPEMAASSEFEELIHSRTKGNPFFVEETLRSLMDKGEIYYKEGRWAMKKVKEKDMPGSLQALLESRFQGLDEETKELIQNACAMGQDFDLNLLREMTGKKEALILELLDRAKKAHIIQPKHPFSDEMYHFSTAGMKDTMYGEIDKETLAQLHKKLGQLKESIYANQPDRAAGVLSYHFKRALDYEKAYQYLKVAEERSKAFFSPDEALDFLEKSLKEKVKEEALPREVAPLEEEIVEAPLSEASKALLVDFVRFFRVGTINLRLYPKGTKMRLAVASEGFSQLVKILKQDKSLTFSNLEGTLLVNGKELSIEDVRRANSEAFVALLERHRVGSLTFKQGVSVNELVSLLEILGEQGESVQKRGGIMAALRAEGVLHIRVSGVMYEKITPGVKKEGGKALEDMALMRFLLGEVAEAGPSGKDFISQLEENPKSIAEFMTKVARAHIPTEKKGVRDESEIQAGVVAQSIQRIGNRLLGGSPEGWKTYRRKLAEAILALEPKLRSKVLRRDVLDEEGRLDDIIGGVIPEFTQGEIISMVKDEYLQGERSIKDIRNLIRRLLPDPQRRAEIIPRLEEELKKIGVPQEEIKLALLEEPSEKMSVDEMATSLMRMPPQAYLAKEMIENISPVIEGLITSKKVDKVNSMVRHMAKYMDDRSPDVRRQIVKALGNVTDALINSGHTQILEELSETLLNHFRKEDDTRAYLSLAENLQQLSLGLIHKGELKSVKEIIKLFKEDIGPESKRTEEQQRHIKNVINNIANPKIIDILVEAFRKKLKANFDDTVAILSGLGDSAVEPLIDALVKEDPTSDPFDVYVTRRSIAETLNKIGPMAISSLKKRLADKNPLIVRYVVEAFGFIGERSVLEDLKALLSHEDPRVRKIVEWTVKQLKERENGDGSRT